MNKNFNINASKIRGYKNTFYAVSLIAIFAMSIVMAFASTASAQVGITQPRTTVGYIDVAPLLVGVGQIATVNLWVLPLPTDYAAASWYNPATNGGTYTGITVTFTRPDGTKDTFTPTDAINVYPAGVMDALGTMYFYYTPNMAGNWSVTMSMPAQNFTDATGTVQWTACTSVPAYFTVTTEAQNAGLLNGWPYSPLPNSNVYWTYPINSNNREWSAISGDWLTSVLMGVSPYVLNDGGLWQQYGPGPETGHILWDIPLAAGGIIGGISGSISYAPYFGDTQLGSIVMDGKLFIEVPTDASSALIKNTFECIDLTTGKVLYTAPGSISGGIDLPGNTYVQATATRGGVTLESSFGSSPVPYLFSSVAGATNSAGLATSVWNYYDPNTGALVRSINNVTASGYYLVDDSPLVFGYTELLQSTTTWIYAVNYVWEWNITKVVGGDWWTGIMWATNTNSPGHPGPGDVGRTVMDVSSDLSTLVYGGGSGNSWAEGFSAKTGKSLWNDTFTYSSTEAQTELFGTNDFFRSDLTTSTYYCYSDLTGALLWSTPNVGIYPYNAKNTGGYDSYVNDNNNLYIANPDGTLVALSLATGKVVWESTPMNSNEYATNVIPYWCGIIEEGGNIYAYAGYSVLYEINPIPRFAMLVCINATTGAITFTLNGGIYASVAADGYVLGLNQYDGNYYCLGKGQTSTSVNVQNDVVAEGATVLIKGNVLDQSPAQPGTPAVSDASQSEWMDYLHMQNATLLNNPPKEQGVPVTLTAVDPNNNTVTIGTTTTDSKGSFYIDWKPSTTGDYKITATFAGSGSYWSSNAETGAVVTSAPTTTSSTSSTTTSSGVSDTALYTGIAAVIVVIIIVGVAIILMQQRKRP